MSSLRDRLGFRHPSRASVSLALIVGALAAGPPSAALARSTSTSTFFKTGTDLTSGSRALSPDTPHAPVGGRVGMTQEGRTIKWVVSYRNETTGVASVNVQDPLTAAGAYVPGSLQLPPGLEPQYSTGSNWLTGEPPAGAAGVGGRGSMAPGTQQLTTFPPAHTFSVTTQAGDGYNAITSPGGAQIYAVFHHNATDHVVACFVAAGTQCPGWPGPSTYVSPQPGVPLGSGPNGMTSGEFNGTFIAAGKLYWPAEQVAPDPDGRHPVGMMCLDLASRLSCGFTQLDRIFYRPSDIGEPSPDIGLIGGSGIPASDGHYWYVDSDANLLCFDPASGGCGTVRLAVQESYVASASATFGDHVLALITTEGAGPYLLYCYDVSHGTPCPGYPVNFGAPAGLGMPPGEIAPVLDQTGKLTAACVMAYANHFGCFDTAGQPVPDPYPATAGWTSQYAGEALALGTKAYVPVNSDNSVGCYDFAHWSGSGTVPVCTGYTTLPSNPTFYTARPVDGVPGCLVADGDGPHSNTGHGTVNTFDAVTGGPCSYASASQTVKPRQYQCGSGAAGFRSWDKLVLSGYPANSYSDAVVTLKDANGVDIPGLSGRVLKYGTNTLDISSLATKAPTDVITAVVALEHVTDASGIAGTTVSVSWKGAPAQICFQTVVPSVACGHTVAVANSATTTTTRRRRRATRDTNSSGDATFLASPTPGVCPVDLAMTKAASSPTVTPGGQVMYTLVVTNNGSSDAVGVHIDDPQPAGLSFVSATPAEGTCSTSAGITCDLGEITKGGSDTILVTANVAADATGTITNSASATSTNPDSDLTNNTATADVSIPSARPTQPSSDLQITKTVDRTSARLGDTLNYTLTVTNKGPDPAADAHVTDASSLSWTVESATPSQGTCQLAAVLHCELGPLAVGTQATVKVTATLDREGTQTNAVVVTSTGKDPVPETNIFRRRAQIVPVLLLRKRVAPRAARSGGHAHYLVTVSNPNAEPLGTVTVCDRLPRELALVSSAPRSHARRSEHCWEIPGMAPGASRRLTLTAVVKSQRSGWIVNRVLAQAPGTPVARARARLRVTGPAAHPRFTG